MKVGLINGRFQPFHLGHLSAIKQALKQVDKLYIAIGSTQYSAQPKNPYPVSERRQMLEIALKENSLEDQCQVFEVPDIHDDSKWTAHVRSIVPAFDTVFVGDEGLVQELFKKDGTPVVLVRHELPISGTEIRKLMNEAGAWQKMVPKSVAELLKTEV